MSEKQLPIYYEWNGKTIKAKNKPVPKSFLAVTGTIIGQDTIENFKRDYVLGHLINGKIKFFYEHSNTLPIQSKGKLILCKL
mgnify:CR=1 FL=1